MAYVRNDLEDCKRGIGAMARRMGFRFDGEAGDNLRFSRAASSDCAPTPADIRAARILAAKIAETYPSIAQLRAIESDVQPDGIEMTVRPGACQAVGMSLKPAQGLSR
jgi:hypothetical protein